MNIKRTNLCNKKYLRESTVAAGAGHVLLHMYEGQYIALTTSSAFNTKTVFKMFFNIHILKCTLCAVIRR